MMGSLARTFGRALWAAFAFAMLRSGLVRLLNRAGDRITVGRGPAVRRRRHRPFQVLMYHRVLEREDDFLPATALEVFDRQMAYLAGHFRVCTLETAVEEMLAGESRDATVVITLDDGYRDNYTHAWPILRKYGLPATLFLTTGSIGSGKVLWHDRVFRAFRRTTVRTLRDSPDIPEPLPLETPAQRDRARDAVLARLKTLDEGPRAEAIARLLERLEVDDVGSIPGLMLDWPEVLEMSRGGISVGSHTVTHPILSRMPAERARREVFDSKAEIERRLGRPVRSFAYPNGQPADFDEGSVALLREAGYRYAVTTIHGVNARDLAGRPPDLLRLRRHVPWDEEESRFAARLGLWRLAS